MDEETVNGSPLIDGTPFNVIVRWRLEQATNDILAITEEISNTAEASALIRRIARHVLTVDDDDT